MSDSLHFPAAPQPEDGTGAELQGTLLGITYRNDENGYTIARLDVEDLLHPVTLVGTMPGVEVGDSLRVKGVWSQHPQYGRQVLVETCEVCLPTGRHGLIQFLGGGRIKGVGPKTAEKIVDALGLDVLERLERDPGLLASVPGIGEARAGAIQRQILEQREVAAAMIFLQEHGLGPGQALRVFKAYGVSTVERVRENPYRLADEVLGIGFKLADKVALSLGHEKDSAFRVAAGLVHLLGRASLEGHVGLPAEQLVEAAAPFLEVDQQRVESVLVECLEDARLVDDGLVYLPVLLQAEQDVAHHVHRLLAAGRPAADLDPDAAVAWAEVRGGLELSDDQRQAVRVALRHTVSVITGGPGVGKTTLVRCLVDILAVQECRLALAAPTGRAARRLEQTTGREAATLHRLLGLTPATFAFHHQREEPLPVDVLVVDEVSMVDTALMAATLEALPDGAAVILVGDVDQLPSVGPGDVLRSFIASGVVPVARLATVFRQSEHSGIVRVAHEINAGRLPHFDEGPEGQAFWVERAEPSAAVAGITALLTERIPERFGLDPLRDVQVLTPMHRGPVGTIALNETLREVLNPPAEGKPELTRFGRLLRQGDKVMQVRNNYDLDVFNGDVGVLVGLDVETGKAAVDFDGRVVGYGLDQLDQLEPAFAITCHKSQGSEFPAVLLPLFASQFRMLRRNLVYTAFTRARQLLVALGESRALQMAVANADTATRHGRLAERLRGEA